MAQEPGKKPGPDFEKYNAMRIAFITERLDLTPEEAEKFWPVYNEFQDRKGQIMKERIENEKYFMDHQDNISEEESARILVKQMELSKKENALDLEYHNKFLEVLSAKKTMKLYLAERHFKSFLLRQIRGDGHRGGRDVPPGK